MANRAPTILLVLGFGLLCGGAVAAGAGLPAKWFLVPLGVALLPLGLGLLGSGERLLAALLVVSLSMQADVTLGYARGFATETPGLPLTFTSLVLLAALARLALLRRAVEWQPGVLIPYALLMIWAALGLFWAPARERVLYRLPLVLEGLALCFVSAQLLRSLADARFLLGAVGLTTALSGLVALAQYLAGTSFDLPFLGELEEGFVGGRFARMPGLWNNPNNLAFFLIGWLPLLAPAALLARGPWLRACAGAGLLAGLVGLVLTQSRGGWAGVLAGLLAALLFLLRMPGAKAGLRGLAARAAPLLLGAAALLILFLPVISHRSAEDMSSFEARITLAATSLKVIASRPLEGTGLDNYAEVVPWYDPNPGLRPDGRPESVHNIYLHTAAEIGLPGLALLLAVLALSLARGARALPCLPAELGLLAAGALGGLVASLVHGLAELGTPGHPKLRGLSFLCGILLGLAGLVAREERALAGAGAPGRRA